MLFKIGEVGRFVRRAQRFRVRPVFLIDDVERQS